ncbi:MAG: ABC transporter ATP-binding protein [Bacteroidales bacterium]
MTALMSAHALTRILPTDPPVTLVRNVDLEIAPGCFHAVVGPSGCGKSSLLYLLGLLDRPTSGSLLFQGVDTDSMDGDERARLRLEQFGFVFQFHFLLPEFTALENVLIPIRRLGRLGGNAMSDQALAILDALGLAAQSGKTPDKMSGGERQRVAIARALANDPSLVLGDEPTGNLDSENSARVIEIFKRMAHDQGRAVVCVTHDPTVAKAADVRIHMLDGAIRNIE